MAKKHVFLKQSRKKQSGGLPGRPIANQAARGHDSAPLDGENSASAAQVTSVRCLSLTIPHVDIEHGWQASLSPTIHEDIAWPLHRSSWMWSSPSPFSRIILQRHVCMPGIGR